MNTKIQQLFKQYNAADIILGGIVDQHGHRRNWVWNPIHGWNHFYANVVFVNPKHDWVINNLTDLYAVMEQYEPSFLLYNEQCSLVRDPFADQPSHEEYLRLRKEYPEPDYIQTLKVKLQHFYPHRTLLLVGDYNHRCQILADAFQGLGWTVHRCSTDIFDIPLNVQSTVLDWDIPTERKERIKYGHHLYKMQKILNSAETDHILVVQNELELDFTHHRKHRVHYYAHEGLWTRLPHNTNITCFFHAYLGAPRQYKLAHGYVMNHVQHKHLIPYAWSPDQYPMHKCEDRPIFFGFMGSVGSTPNKEDVDASNYLAVKLRHLRNKIVPHAERRCGLDVHEKGTEKDYIAYMHQVRLALNVSSEFGWTSERQYHAMGLGCVLVQNAYNGLEALGFKDRVNCLIYKDEYDLEEVIDWAKLHPDELEAIRQAGMTLAKQNTYRDRVQAMMEAMLKYE
jgi:hypothetical protein